MEKQSNIKSRFSEYLQEYRIDNLSDRNGERFGASTDAEYKGSLIVFKNQPLNTVRTMSASTNKLSAQLAYRVPHYKNNPEDIPKSQDSLISILRGLGYLQDCQNWSFDNSAEMQSIVANHLRKEGKQLLVVFSNHPEIIRWRGKRINFKDYYKSEFGIDVMVESEWWGKVSGKAKLAA